MNPSTMRSVRTLAFLAALCGVGVPLQAGDLDTLRDWMTGSFSSEAQASEDSSFFDIRLEMVPIWPDRKDGPWLYVEQAAATSLDTPYRQRVYHLSVQDDGRFRSEVYSMADPLLFAGAWREPEKLAALEPADLILRQGCAVILEGESAERFRGSTVDKQCESALRGATYATSEVIVTADGIESWDRGYSSADDQVWGAEKGPYLFRRTP